MHRYDKYINNVSFSISELFIFPYSCCIIEMGGSQLSISVQDSSDHGVVDIDSCYPISTTSCNLRSAWFLCNSLCKEEDDDVSSGSSPSVCLINLLYKSSISMNLTYGSLELNYNSAIAIDGNEAAIESHSEVSKSLFSYQNISFNDEFTNSYNSSIINRPYLLINNMSIDGFHSNDGGVIFIDGSCDLTLTYITFRNNTAANVGGAIYINHNQYSSTIMNNSFMSCSSSYKGGSIYIDKMNNEVMISNNIFFKSTGSFGGGIYINNKNKNIVMRENNFNDGFADYDGGAVFVYEKNDGLAVYSNTFDYCRANGRGGGIMISNYNTQMTFSSNSFNKCSSKYGGGLYFDQNVDNTIIQHNNFTSCSASYSGGGMYFHGNDKVIIHNNSFLHCFAYQSGCAIAIDANNTNFNITYLIVASCTIDRPGLFKVIIENAGGAIYLGKYNSHVSIATSHFTNITSYTYGTIACMMNNGFIQIYENKFEHISLPVLKGMNAGSAIMFKMQNYHLQIFRNEFVNCTAMFAAALGFDHGNFAALIQHNNFTDCKAINDAGILVNEHNHDMKFISNVFFNFTANTGAMVIGLFNYDIIIADSIFQYCHAKLNGGAIQVGTSNNKLTFDNLLIDSCSSNSRGGSIHLGTNNSDIMIKNTKIINSSSVYYGGGIYIGSENFNINITYCSFIDNYCYEGGALYFDKMNNNIYFVGNLFQNNSAVVDGGACYFNEANDNVQFIDEDSFKSIVTYYDSK